MDVIFPEVVSFPLQQRFMLHGAYEDTTWLASMTIDESEKWAVIERGGAEDLQNYEGICNENALRFRKMKAIEVMMAIDPDTGQDDSVDPSATHELDDGD